MRTLPCFLVALLLALLVPTPGARAQDEAAKAAARSLAQEGAGLFETGNFQGALDKFEQAYAQFPSPKLFFNMGLALRGLSRNVEALEAFERFLAEATDASGEHREQANTQAADLKSKLARITVDCNRPGAVVSIDGLKRGTIPLGRPLMVEPGSHRLTLTSDAGFTSSDFTAEAGQELSRIVTFELAKAPAESVVDVPKPQPEVLLPTQAPTPPPERDKISRRTWYWIAGGAVLAATAATLIVLFTRSDEYPGASLGTRTIP
jgi:tetratricopeptide (TPR) repeat protein